MYQVSSVNKLGSSHRSERTAQAEAAKRIKDGDTEVSIDRVTRGRWGYEYTRVEVYKGE